MSRIALTVALALACGLAAQSQEKIELPKPPPLVNEAPPPPRNFALPPLPVAESPKPISDKNIKVSADSLEKTFHLKLTKFHTDGSRLAIVLEFTKNVDSLEPLKELLGVTPVPSLQREPPAAKGGIPPTFPIPRGNESPFLAPAPNPMPPRESKLSVLLFDEDNVCLAELPVSDVEGKLTGQMGDALRVNVPNLGAKDKLKKVELRLPATRKYLDGAQHMTIDLNTTVSPPTATQVELKAKE
jgi:hypothetical protein